LLAIDLFTILLVVVTNKDEDYLVDHSIFLYLMDKEGSFLSHHGSQYDAHALAQRIATDVRSKVRPEPSLPFFPALRATLWLNSLLFRSLWAALLFFRTIGGLSTVVVGTAQGERQQFRCHLHSLTYLTESSSGCNQQCMTIITHSWQTPVSPPKHFRSLRLTNGPW
jgi:hypothetical protein